MYPKTYFMERWRYTAPLREYIPVSVAGYREMTSIGGFDNIMRKSAASVYASSRTKVNPFLTVWSVTTQTDIDNMTSIANMQRQNLRRQRFNGREFSDMDIDSIIPLYQVYEHYPIPLYDFYDMIGFENKRWQGKTVRQYILDNDDLDDRFMPWRHLK